MSKNVVDPERSQMTMTMISKATRVGEPTCTNTQKCVGVILLFYGKSGLTNASQCYVIRTLPVLLCIVRMFYLEKFCRSRTRFYSANINGNWKRELPLVYAITPLRMRLFAHASRLHHRGVGRSVVTIHPAPNSLFVSQRVHSFRLCACIITISQTGHRKWESSTPDEQILLHGL